LPSGKSLQIINLFIQKPFEEKKTNKPSCLFSDHSQKIEHTVKSKKGTVHLKTWNNRNKSKRPSFLLSLELALAFRHLIQKKGLPGFFLIPDPGSGCQKGPHPGSPIRNNGLTDTSIVIPNRVQPSSTTLLITNIQRSETEKNTAEIRNKLLISVHRH
jgi:hypothetical protein